MSCLAAIFSGKFWLCSSHPAVLGLEIQALARLAHMQSCGLSLCFPVAMTAGLFFPFSLLAVLFFVSCHSPCFLEKARTLCCTDRNQCGLLSLSSMFCVSCSGGECAGLWLEMLHSGLLPECWFVWKSCSLSLASVVSVV